MKKYLLLLVGLTIIACSKDDDNSNNNSDAETFLQRFDGLGFSNSEGDVYFYFYNANTFMKSVGRYDDNSTECFSVNEGTNIEESDNYEFNISIITNENNVLFFEEIYIEDGNTYRDTYRFTSNSAGDQITLMWDEDPDDIEVFTRTNTTHSSLCN